MRSGSRDRFAKVVGIRSLFDLRQELLNRTLAYPDPAALWAVQIQCNLDRNAHQQDEADRTSNVGTPLDALLAANQQRGDDRAGEKQEHDAVREAVPVGRKQRGLVARNSIER